MPDFHLFGGRVSRYLKPDLSPTSGPPDEAYLSYYDVRVTRGDTICIKNDDWLTDNCIAFWEEYLEHEVLPEYPRARIVLLRPTMSHMMLNNPHPRGLRSALPDFSGTTHVFLPVNDCRELEQAEGGSHWSLLVVSMLDNLAFHYDSMFPNNRPHAADLADKFSQLLGQRLQFVNLPDSPQQTNNKDCGIFVCLLIQHLLRRLLSDSAEGKINMSMRGQAVDAAGGRKEILRIIDDLREEGERRRSTSKGRSPSRSSKNTSGSPPRICDENS